MDKFTKKEFDARFPNDDACLEWLKDFLYPNGIFCETCNKTTTHHKVAKRRSYSCAYCGHHVHPTADTIYHKSTTPLRDWFYAVFLMSNTRTGISAMHLKRELGVTYKTAWRMFNRIREMMENETMTLFGEVEIDETYIGGQQPGKRGRGAEGKSIAVGLVQRGGKAVVKVTPNVRAKSLLPIITEHIPVAKDTIVYTDELPSYNRLAKMGFRHERVQHSAKQYVNGTAHVNNVEGLWSTIKNGILGANKHVSPQHLQGYLDAYVFRFNHRQDSAPMFLTMLRQVRKA
ncbi:MAG: IS1595 family transposase [Chloroflexi bacterium]|nr:IS1595 family transposase [Chloroflexota bacterium]